jgi:hypothetical protein
MSSSRKKGARTRKTASSRTKKTGSASGKVRKRKATGRTPAKQAGRTAGKSRRSAKKWSQRVTRNSDALDLEQGVFKLRSAAAIAKSLKRSADRSERRKAEPYRSAVSMLTFYINRAGRTLGAAERRRLEAAKRELARLYGKRPR